MKQHIVMSKKTGDLGLMVKLVLFDNPDEEVMETENFGKIVWLPNEPDFAGIITCDNGAYALLPFSYVIKQVEIIGEL